MSRVRPASGAKPSPAPTESFLALHEHGPTQLAARLARVDWSRADALPAARAALALFVGTIAELLRIEARSRRMTVARLLAALARSNDPAELPLLGLVLSDMEQASPLPGLATRQRTAFAAAAAQLAAHARLLREGDLPATRLDELAPVDTESLLVVLARQQSGAGTTPPRTALQLLKLAARDDAPRATLLRRLRLVRTLLEGKAFALDYKAFRTLPASLRDVLLFTPDLLRAFLTPQAQAAARPPSPGFDPLFLDRALAELRRGRLGHVELDTLFLGARAAKFRAGIVAALAEGSGDIACTEDVRERLLANAQTAEFCLLACAVATRGDETRRALAQLTASPAPGLLAEALRGFASIAWRDALPSDLPDTWRAQGDFCRELFEESATQLLGCLGGDTTRMPSALRFRQFTAWLACIGAPSAAPRHEQTEASGLKPLVVALHTQGHVLAAEIDGHDLYALYCAGPAGPQLALTLAAALRESNRARWEHGFLTRLVDLDPAVALVMVDGEPNESEAEILGLSRPADPAVDAGPPALPDPFMDVDELFS